MIVTLFHPPHTRMEIRSISSLLEEQATKTVEAVVTHFEDLKNMSDDDGDPIEAVVVAFTLNGVTNIGTCVVDLNRDGDEDDAADEAVQEFKKELRSCWEDGTAITVTFSVPGAEAKFGFPMISRTPAKTEGEAEEEAKA